MIRERRSGAAILIIWLLAWAAAVICIAQAMLR